MTINKQPTKKAATKTRATKTRAAKKATGSSARKTAPAINATAGNQIDLLATTLGGGAAA